LKAQATPGHELVWYRTATGGVGATRPPIPATNVAGTFDYWVSQRIIFGGCEGPRNKITVTITTPPTVSFVINDSRQCLLGNNFSFSNTSTNTQTNSTYTWDLGDTILTNSPIINHSYTNTGTYWVKLTVNNGGCFKSLTQFVNVIDHPIAAFTYPSVICENQTAIVLQNTSYVPNGSGLINNWWWQINGNISTASVPPAFTHAAGTLTVKLVATTADGCRSDTTIHVLNCYARPVSKIGLNTNLCNNEVIQIKDLSFVPNSTSGQIVKWNWFYDNVLSSGLQNPAIFLSAGQHLISLQTETDKGCKSISIDSLITVNPKPAIALHISDSCVFRNIDYTASAISNVPVNKWIWNFGFGFSQGNATVTKKYVHEDAHTVILIGESNKNCKDTIIRPLVIYYNRAKAMMDTVAAKNEPVQLTTAYASNMRTYNWTPTTGLNNSTVQNPIATYDMDQTYELNTLTAQGCDSYSKILVRRFIGPEIYVANAFTPNRDRTNDTLHVFPVGIKAFNYFKIFNRKGQLVFETYNFRKGWDGKFKGEWVEQDNFVWMASAIDYKGNVLFRKGNVLVLR
jgi:gliding motility-associated-like protein